MGQDPSEIRAAIVATRERMSETINALVYTSDVKARAAEAVDERVDAAKHTLTQTLQAARAGRGERG